MANPHAQPDALCHVAFRLRAAERALPPDVEEFLRMWGTEIWAAGARQITMSLPKLPAELRDTMIARRAQDWILVAPPTAR